MEGGHVSGMVSLSYRRSICPALAHPGVFGLIQEDERSWLCYAQDRVFVDPG